MKNKLRICMLVAMMIFVCADLSANFPSIFNYTAVVEVSNEVKQ